MTRERGQVAHDMWRQKYGTLFLIRMTKKNMLSYCTAKSESDSGFFGEVTHEMWQQKFGSLFLMLAMKRKF